MYFNEKVDLKKSDNRKAYILTISGEEPITIGFDHPTATLFDKVYDKAREYSPSERPSRTELIEELFGVVDVYNGKTEAKEVAEITPSETLTRGLTNLIKFFTEFQFEPNFRFVNSLSLALAESKTKAKEYIGHYFDLTDNPYHREIKEKVKSAEFKGILNDLSAIKPTRVVNNRFKLYYGSQGTGKTTLAMEETEGRCMVCNSSMLPADLMEDFVFVDGKATFSPSALWESMTEGKQIVLDEINLLPFDSLRFLQTILDGKKEFIYKGKKVTIADGFKIIGTMNLTVNGMTYALPDPLVDRCETMRKFTLSATDLVNAIMQQRGGKPPLSFFLSKHFNALVR